MKRVVLLLTLVIGLSATAQAEWKTGSITSDAVAYYDPSTLRILSADERRIWTLISYAKSADGVWSQRDLMLYNCRDGTWKHLAFVATDEKMGQGRVVQANNKVAHEAQFLAPGTAGWDLMRAVCEIKP